MRAGMRGRTAAIIQARMGSTRLPGKVLMKLGEKSVLGFLVERLSSSETIDDIVVATTTETRDDAIVAEAEHLGIGWFRGSETNVLGRYVAAAHAYGSEVVVRVTGDNPFTDPHSIDRVVRQLWSGYDYAIENDMPIGTTGEALTLSALEFIDKVACTDRWREHVTLYAKENPHMLRCSFMNAPSEYARPDLSYTVDHDVEYQQVRQLCAKLQGPKFLLKNLISLADI